MHFLGIEITWPDIYMFFVPLCLMLITAFVTNYTVNKQIKNDNKERQKDRGLQTDNVLLLTKLDKLNELAEHVVSLQLLTTSRSFEDNWLKLGSYAELGRASSELIEVSKSIQLETMQFSIKMDFILRIYFPHTIKNLDKISETFNQEESKISFYFGTSFPLEKNLSEPPDGVKEKAKLLSKAYSELTYSYIKIINEESKRLQNSE